MVMLLKETPPPEGCTTHAQGELISQADGRHINTHIGIYTHRHTHLHNTVALRSSITCKVRCSHREMTGTLAHTHRHTHTHLHSTVALRSRITCRVRCSHREMTGKASKYSLASTRMEAIPSKPERKSVTLHLRSAGSTGRCHT
jgi:ribosomal protein S18